MDTCVWWEKGIRTESDMDGRTWLRMSQVTVALRPL